jgi:hypothetical protein
MAIGIKRVQVTKPMAFIDTITMLKLQWDRLPMLLCQAVMLTLLLRQLTLKRPGTQAITCGHKGIFSPRFSLAGYFPAAWQRARRLQVMLVEDW